MTEARMVPESLLPKFESARRWVVLTGAGISAESGVPTFRGEKGLWEGSRPEELASVDGFLDDPARVWRWYRWRRDLIRAVEPNAGHEAIATIERKVSDFCLATQNVDGLHARAGSARILELHGNILESHCLNGCGIPGNEEVDAEVPLCPCGAPLRPSVVWFGEMLPADVLREAFAEAGQCDVCLVVGTSGLVYPAAGLPGVAADGGALLIEVNPEETPLSAGCDLALRGPAAELLPAFLREVGLGEEPDGKGGV